MSVGVGEVLVGAMLFGMISLDAQILWARRPTSRLGTQIIGHTNLLGVQTLFGHAPTNALYKLQFLEIKFVKVATLEIKSERIRRQKNEGNHWTKSKYCVL